VIDFEAIVSDAQGDPSSADVNLEMNRHCVNRAASACLLLVVELPAMFYKKESQQETLRLRLNSC
jgi:hypothetical protein